MIVAADHGEALHEHGWVGHNLQVYEESIHIPLIVRFPSGRGPAGMRIAGLTDLLDVAPTIADAFGVMGRGGSADSFRGRSLFPVIAGAPGKAAVLSRTLWDRPRYSLRTPREKLVYDSRTGKAELFDLVADPKEATNRAAEDALKAAYYSETVRATLMRLAAEARRETQPTPPPVMTCETCENMKSLGYLDSSYPCPCP